MKLKLTIFGLSIGLISCISSKEKTDNEIIQPEVYSYNMNASGIPISINFEKGNSHNHPLMAIWIEDSDGKYVQTIYVAQSIGKGIFNFGDKSSGKWMPGPVRRPAALPYWSHKRNIKEDDSLYIPKKTTPIPDAYTGPTPKNNFIINAKTDSKINSFKILFEINQSWDWNEYWTNSKFPNDLNYKTSSQPAIVYSTELINVNNITNPYVLKPIGHSHYSGKDGSLTTDLSTISTALNIARNIEVKINIE